MGLENKSLRELNNLLSSLNVEMANLKADERSNLSKKTQYEMDIRRRKKAIQKIKMEIDEAMKQLDKIKKRDFEIQNQKKYTKKRREEILSQIRNISR